MTEAKNPKFSETDVTLLLHDNCGWNDINRFPASVYVEHECDREHPYEEAGHTFYDRTHLRYVPERTCRNNAIKQDQFICTRCGVFLDIADMSDESCESNYEPNFCPDCGSLVVR